MAIDRGEPDLYVKLPERPDLVGTMMRGHTMGAIKDGWIVYYYDLRRPPTDGLIGELCIVMTEGGRKLIRYLHRGHLPGTWDLVTDSGNHMLDVVLQWAEKVVLIQPYVPNGEELAKLAKHNSVSTE